MTMRDKSRMTDTVGHPLVVAIDPVFRVFAAALTNRSYCAFSWLARPTAL